MIEFKNITKIFRNKVINVNALNKINLTIENGDIFGVIGSSGAGKSTLIRLVNGLEKPTSGDIIVNGQNIVNLSKPILQQVRKNIGMVFQQFNILDSKTVYENIAIPLIINKVAKSEIKKRVNELLEYVELSDKIYVHPSKLSGGQKQRVGIARALATNPSILLCDEATSALDPKTTKSILELLKKINKEFNITILIITHDMSVIQDICNKVAVMDQGQIIEEGSVIDVFGNPKSSITKEFVRSVIDDTIPLSIVNSLQAHMSDSKIVKLKFIGSTTKSSLISEINKRFAVTTNILFANVKELQETVLGIIILQIIGNVNDIHNVTTYICEMGIEYEEVVIS